VSAELDIYPWTLQRCRVQPDHVERTVNRLKGWRRVATRYEKREVNYLAMVTIAAIVLLWLE
jgi:transposase